MARMNRLLLILFIGMCLPGCKSMTNEQIIVETKKCRDAGMGVDVFMNIDAQVVAVVCNPDKKP